MTFIGSPSEATLIILRGTLSSTKIGDSNKSTFSQRTFAILNTDTGEGTLLTYGKSNGFKYYFVNELTDVVVAKVVGSRGITYTAAQFAITVFGPGNDIHVSSFYMRGKDTNMPFGGGVTTAFPKTSKGVARFIIREGSNSPQILEQSLSYIFDSNRTIAANDASKTMGTVISELEVYLSAEGYTESAQ